jgi:hypothetical protein
VGAAHPDDEATGVARLELRVQCRHLVGREPVDGDDPAGDPRPLGRSDHRGDLVQVGERTAGEPNGRIAHRLQLNRGVDEDVPCPEPTTAPTAPRSILGTW